MHSQVPCRERVSCARAIRGIFALVASCLLCGAVSSATARSLTVEDTLALESVVDSRPSPDGRYILLIRTLASAAKTDYSQDLILGPKSGQLLVIDVRDPERIEPLIGIPGETYALGPFSPDARRVLVYWFANRRLGLGCYDFATRRFTRFSPTPQLNSRTDFGPVWVSEDEIIYDSVPDGEQPFDSFNRPETARKLSEYWSQTWSGRLPSVIVSESRSDGGGTAPQPGMLVQSNVRTGSTKAVAEGVYSDLRLSPDNRFLAALRHYSSGQPPLPLNLDWTSDRRLQLVIFDLKSPAPAFATHDLTVGLGSLEWAPAGNKLAFFAWSPAGTSATGLYRIYDASNGRLSFRPHTGLDLVSERERGWFPRPERAAWLGDGLAVAARAQGDPNANPTFTPRDYARLTPASGVGWYVLERNGSVTPLTSGLGSVSPVLVTADRDKLVVVGDGRLWQLSPDGSRTPLLEHRYDDLGLAFPPTVRDGIQKKPVVLVAAGKGLTSYLIPDFSGHSATLRIKVAPRESLLAATGDGTALLADEAQLSTRILLRRGAQQVPLLRLNSYLDGVGLAERRQLTYKGPQGEELTGCVILPHDYVAGQRYPTIVHIYPGVTGKCGPSIVDFVSDKELLAAHGYVVLWPGNPPDSIRTPDGPIAGMAGVVENATRAAIAAGYSDPDRLGLWGSSQGGFSSLWLATQMKQFKAVVSGQGWADLPSHYLGADHQNLLFPDNMPYALHTTRYEPEAGSEFSIGKTLWQAPDIYMKNSPTMHADQVTAPVMLISSDMDIFPLWQYQEMYTALYRLRKPSCLVVYMGEGHWPQSPANVKDLWTRVLSWFDFHLRNGRSKGCSRPGNFAAVRGAPIAK